MGTNSGTCGELSRSIQIFLCVEGAGCRSGTKSGWRPWIGAVYPTTPLSLIGILLEVMDEIALLMKRIVAFSACRRPLNGRRCPPLPATHPRTRGSRMPARHVRRASAPVDCRSSTSTTGPPMNPAQFLVWRSEVRKRNSMRLNHFRLHQAPCFQPFGERELDFPR